MQDKKSIYYLQIERTSQFFLRDDASLRRRGISPPEWGISECHRRLTSSWPPSSVVSFESRGDQTLNETSLSSLAELLILPLFLSLVVSQYVRTMCACLLSADCPDAATRDSLPRRREWHRHRGADGERAGEAGENVFQAGRVQASKLEGKMSKLGVFFYATRGIERSFETFIILK